MSVQTSLFRNLRGAWQRLPEALRYKAWQTAGPKVQTAYALRQLARPAPRRPQRTDAPLVVAGLFSTANGIGEAARATYRALKAAGLSPIAVDLSQHLAPVDMASGIPCQPMPDSEDGTLILQLNGPETIAAIQHLNMRRGRKWFTIGYWAWELPSFPDGWEKAYPYISELWTISNFSEQALRCHSRTPPTRVFPHAVAPPETIAVDRQQFGWSDDAFVFLTMADSMSSLQRKNPFAAITAFKQAFGDDHERLLVVKTRNLERDPKAFEDLHAAIGQASNIRLLDVSLSEAKRWELLQAADAVVSLHRSEGFGFVLAEAMALGKPVIATAWSGNMDFTCSETAFLVDCDIVPCQDAYGIYSNASASWADVTLADAQAQMQTVVSDPWLRRQKAQAAVEKMKGWASEARVGTEMASRLASIPAG